MKKGLIIGVIAVIVVAVILLSVGVLNINNREGASKRDDIGVVDLGKISGQMEIISVFEQGQAIPEQYTADGEDVNPPLEIIGIPDETKSLVLIVDDPDAPVGLWVHWLVFNIPIIDKIKENSVPKDSIQGTNSWGRTEYGGPDPPSGVHRYFFKVYALDIELNLEPSTEKEDIEKDMEGHILDHAELMGVYGRE